MAIESGLLVINILLQRTLIALLLMPFVITIASAGIWEDAGHQPGPKWWRVNMGSSQSDSGPVATNEEWVVYALLDNGVKATIARIYNAKTKRAIGVLCARDDAPCFPFYSDGSECEQKYSYPVMVVPAGASNNNKKLIDAGCSILLGDPVLYLPGEYVNEFVKRKEFSIDYLPAGKTEEKDINFNVFSLKGSSKAINKARELTGNAYQKNIYSERKKYNEPDKKITTQQLLMNFLN